MNSNNVTEVSNSKDTRTNEENILQIIKIIFSSIHIYLSVMIGFGVSLATSICSAFSAGTSGDANDCNETITFLLFPLITLLGAIFGIVPNIFKTNVGPIIVKACPFISFVIYLLWGIGLILYLTPFSPNNLVINVAYIVLCFLCSIINFLSIFSFKKKVSENK